MCLASHCIISSYYMCFKGGCWFCSIYSHKYLVLWYNALQFRLWFLGGLAHYRCNCVCLNVLAGARFHTAWATDLAAEDTLRETRSEIETSVLLTSIQMEGEIGKLGGSDGCQRVPLFCPLRFYSHGWFVTFFDWQIFSWRADMASCLASCVHPCVNTIPLWWFLKSCLRSSGQLAAASVRRACMYTSSWIMSLWCQFENSVGLWVEGWWLGVVHVGWYAKWAKRANEEESRVPSHLLTLFKIHLSQKNASKNAGAPQSSD